MYKLILGCLLTFAAMSFTFQADTKGPWEHLGTRKVDYMLDRDEIMVTRMEGTFTALKFMVKHSPVDINKMVVHFGNGEVQEIEVRDRIRAGGESRVIDLPGNRRVIQKVVFWYDTKNYASRKGVVELWGKH
jgi:Protein of unknown function (DUF2541)